MVGGIQPRDLGRVGPGEVVQQPRAEEGLVGLGAGGEVVGVEREPGAECGRRGVGWAWSGGDGADSAVSFGVGERGGGPQSLLDAGQRRGVEPGPQIGSEAPREARKVASEITTQTGNQG